jgi:hypothetical protein
MTRVTVPASVFWPEHTVTNGSWMSWPKSSFTSATVDRRAFPLRTDWHPPHFVHVLYLNINIAYNRSLLQIPLPSSIFYFAQVDHEAITRHDHCPGDGLVGSLERFCSASYRIHQTGKLKEFPTHWKPSLTICRHPYKSTCSTCFVSRFSTC